MSENSIFSDVMVQIQQGGVNRQCTDPLPVVVSLFLFGDLKNQGSTMYYFRGGYMNFLVGTNFKLVSGTNFCRFLSTTPVFMQFLANFWPKSALSSST